MNYKAMSYEDAKSCCHVRSAIARASKPSIKYWKNHTVSLDDRVPDVDKAEYDWYEYDPREQADSSSFNEMPA